MAYKVDKERTPTFFLYNFYLHFITVNHQQYEVTLKNNETYTICGVINVPHMYAWTLSSAHFQTNLETELVGYKKTVSVSS